MINEEHREYRINVGIIGYFAFGISRPQTRDAQRQTKGGPNKPDTNLKMDFSPENGDAFHLSVLGLSPQTLISPSAPTSLRLPSPSPSLPLPLSLSLNLPLPLPLPPSLNIPLPLPLSLPSFLPLSLCSLSVLPLCPCLLVLCAPLCALLCAPLSLTSLSAPPSCSLSRASSQCPLSVLLPLPVLSPHFVHPILPRAPSFVPLGAVVSSHPI